VFQGTGSAGDAQQFCWMSARRCWTSTGWRRHCWGTRPRGPVGAGGR